MKVCYAKSYRRLRELQATRRRVPYKWRQICRNRFVNICTLDKKGRRVDADMQRDSVLEFFSIELRLTLTFRKGQAS